MCRNLILEFNLSELVEWPRRSQPHLFFLASLMPFLPLVCVTKNFLGYFGYNWKRRYVATDKTLSIVYIQTHWSEITHILTGLLCLQACRSGPSCQIRSPHTWPGAIHNDACTTHRIWSQPPCQIRVESYSFCSSRIRDPRYLPHNSTCHDCCSEDGFVHWGSPAL